MLLLSLAWTIILQSIASTTTMSFHFPGSAPRPQRRVSFDSGSKKAERDDQPYRVENPLLGAAKSPTSHPPSSTPQHPSPFAPHQPKTTMGGGGGLILKPHTPVVGLRQRKPSSAAAGAPTGGDPNSIHGSSSSTKPKPPPIESYSWGASAVPSLVEDSSHPQPLGGTPVSHHLWLEQ